MCYSRDLGISLSFDQITKRELPLKTKLLSLHAISQLLRTSQEVRIHEHST